MSPIACQSQGNGMLRVANAGATIAPNLLVSLSQLFERSIPRQRGWGLDWLSPKPSPLA